MFRKNVKKISLFTILVCGGLGKSLSAAEQAQYPILPAKEEIQQAVLESDVVRSSQLVPQLAPLIAAYADNTVKGYLTLSQDPIALPAGCYGTNYEEWKEFYQKKLGKSVFYFPGAIINNRMKLSDFDLIVPNIRCGSTAQEVSASVGLAEPCIPNQNSIFPKSIPQILVLNKREGDEISFDYEGRPFVLTCNQRALNPEAPENFEDALARIRYLTP